MRYLDVCAGISASTVAWKPLGWEAAAYSEIEAAPRAILAHHYPDTPLHGDFTTIRGDEYGAIDLLVGGTPCQDFSIAGFRAGLDGERGNLSLEYLRLADRTRPRWLVWENVPGVLSIDGGRAFGAILGGMGELGYGFAYRVLDAQFFNLAQRRKRVFVVGCLGDWRRAAAVLFERHSLSGNPAPSRQSQPAVAGNAGRRAAFGGNDTRGPIDVSTALSSHGGPHGRIDFESETFVAEVFSIMPMNSATDYVARRVDIAQPVMAGGPVGGNQGGDYVAYRSSGNCGAWDTGDRVDALTSAHDGAAQHLLQRSGRVRRLTPREWERLQGFSDDYTLVPYRKGMMADGPRYKALGNSMAVPVMRWIGERIAAVEAIQISKDIAA